MSMPFGSVLLQIWAAGFTAAILKKRSSTVNAEPNDAASNSLKKEPLGIENLMLSSLEKLFPIFLELPDVNKYASLYTHSSASCLSFSLQSILNSFSDSCWQEANENHPETLWEPSSMSSALSLQLRGQSCAFSFRRVPDPRTTEDGKKHTFLQFRVVSSCRSLQELSWLVHLTASQILARVLHFKTARSSMTLNI